MRLMLMVQFSTGARFLIQIFDSFRGSAEPIIRRWRDIIVLTQWSKKTQQTAILFLRVEPTILQGITAHILRDLPGSPTSDPLWPYIHIIENYLNLQDKATYFIRDLTDFEEQQAELNEHKESKTNYGRLHEVSRASLTVTEILKVNTVTMENIIDYHEKYMESEFKTLPWEDPNSLPPAHKTATTIRKAHQRLLLYSHIVQSICLRATSYADRMKNQIALAFHLVAQDEAHTSVEIARAAKADSQAMKLTSLIALIFLPPMFISAVFSTTFFDFDASTAEWRVSAKFYLYWVVVVPITASSVLLWYLFIFKKNQAINCSKFLRQRYFKKRVGDAEMCR